MLSITQSRIIRFLASGPCAMLRTSSLCLAVLFFAPGDLSAQPQFNRSPQQDMDAANRDLDTLSDQQRTTLERIVSDVIILLRKNGCDPSIYDKFKSAMDDFVLSTGTELEIVKQLTGQLEEMLQKDRSMIDFDQIAVRQRAVKSSLRRAEENLGASGRWMLDFADASLASGCMDFADAQYRTVLKMDRSRQFNARALVGIDAVQAGRNNLSTATGQTTSAARPPRRNDISQVQRRSQEFVVKLYSTLSGSAVTLAQTLNDFYADTVRYYGKEMSREQVITEVQRFFARWPARQYKPKEGSVIINCDEVALTCTVTGVVEFDAQSALRNQRSTGEATFEYLLRFSSSYQQMPKIATEDGSVLERNVQALSSDTNGSPFDLIERLNPKPQGKPARR